MRLGTISWICFVLLLSWSAMMAGVARAADGAGTKITVEEATTLAQSIEKSIAAGDATVFQNLFDQKAFFDIAVGGLPLSPKSRAGFETGANIKQTLIQALADGVKTGATYHFLHLNMINGAPRPVFRLIQPTRGLNYHELALARSVDGTVRVVDLYLFATGELFSQSFHRVAIPLAASEHRDVSQPLLGSDNDYMTHANDMASFRTLSGSGPLAQALAIYAKLPESLQHDKLSMILRLSDCEHAQPETYPKALSDFEALYPGDPSLMLLKIDSLIRAKDYDGEVDDLDQLGGRVGGDAVLELMAARARLAQHRSDDAKAFLLIATQHEPSLRAPWEILIDLSLKAKDNAETARLLDESAKAAGIRWTKVATARGFADFVNSPEGAEWVKNHPQHPVGLGPKPDNLRLN